MEWIRRNRAPTARIRVFAGTPNPAVMRRSPGLLESLVTEVEEIRSFVQGEPP
jgi:hypothetical protein